MTSVAFASSWVAGLMGRLDMAMSLTLAEEMDDVLTRGSDWGYPVRRCSRNVGR